jgi:hypothetical protein
MGSWGKCGKEISGIHGFWIQAEGLSGSLLPQVVGHALAVLDSRECGTYVVH